MLGNKSAASPALPLVALYMAFNFLSSVGIINLNKMVFKEYAFNYPTFLTGLHFIITFAGLIVCNMAGMFQIKRVPLVQIIPLSLTFTGFVIFNNLSLQLNSLGFYQLMKVLTTPSIVVIQLLAFSVPLHNKLKLALMPICIGVCMATVSDMEINFWGTVWAIMGILSTSFYQIYVKSKQQDLGLDSYQLLFLQAPSSAILVFLISFFTEPYFGPKGLLEFPYSVESLSAILGTGVLSFCVNLSIFLVIGKTSPIAYNVLGHFKLVCILASGFVFFGESTNATKTLGTVMTFVGVLLYTHWQQNLQSGWEGRDKKAAEAAQASKERALAAVSPSAEAKEQRRLLEGGSPDLDLEAQTDVETDVEDA